jgi:hypothetical protein
LTPRGPVGSPVSMDLEQRLETLEKNLKKTQAIAGAAFGLAMVAFLFAIVL